MDNRILDAYNEFNKNTEEVSCSGIFGFTFAFKAGVKAEKARIEKRIREAFNIMAEDPVLDVYAKAATDIIIETYLGES